MEQQPPIPENSAEKSPEKKEKRLKRLAHYLSKDKDRPRLIRFDDTITPEAEQAKTVETRKDRFFNRLHDGWWRRLFHGNIVSTEFVSTEGEASVDEPKPEQRPQPSRAEAPGAAREEPPAPPETETTADHVTPPTEASAETPPPPEPPEGPPPEILPPPEAASPGPAARAAAEHVMAPFSSTESTTPTPPVERVIVERPRGAAAVAALLGLEYLGRKRADRKIRKDVAKQMSRQQKDTRSEFNRADEHARSTAREVREVKDQQRAFETKLNAAKSQEAAPPPEIKQPTPELKLPELEVPPTEKQPTVGNIPLAEQVVQQTESLQKPEAVREQVAVAAEQNIPVEAVYERRHEVKKDQPQALGGGGGGPGQSTEPTLLADALHERLPHVDLPGGVPTWQKQPSPATQPEDVYKQAIKRGLWGAVALLIFIAILFLIAH